MDWCNQLVKRRSTKPSRSSETSTHRSRGRRLEYPNSGMGTFVEIDGIERQKKHAQIKNILNDMDFQAGNSCYCFPVFGSRPRPCAGRRLCGLPVGDKRVKPRLQVGRWDQVWVLSDFPARLCECHLCSWEVHDCCSLSVSDDLLFESIRCNCFIRSSHSRRVST